MKKYDNFLGEKIKIESASEPTDIIWENREFSAFPKTRLMYRFVVSFIICILLVISAGLIFFCQETSLSLKGRYPKINCGIPKDITTGKYKSGFIFEEYPEIAEGDVKGITEGAVREYEFNESRKNKGLKTRYKGYL